MNEYQGFKRNCDSTEEGRLYLWRFIFVERESTHAKQHIMPLIIMRHMNHLSKKTFTFALMALRCVIEQDTLTPA